MTYGQTERTSHSQVASAQSLQIQLALACFELTLGLIDDVNAAAPAYETVGSMACQQRLQRISNFHFHTTFITEDAATETVVVTQPILSSQSWCAFSRIEEPGT